MPSLSQRALKSVPKPKKKKKHEKISWWIKECDTAMSLLVRSKGFCDASDVSTCGGGLQHSHTISRTNDTLRYDIINALSLCYKHHIHFWHASPLEAMQWFQRKFPERYEYLMEARNTITPHRTIEDYKQILQDIKDKNYKALIFGAKLPS